MGEQRKKMPNGLEPIDDRIKDYISQQNVYVLRDKRTDCALNASYSPEGLKWTANKYAKLLCFKNAYISEGKVKGDLTPNNRVYVEQFVPKDHPHNRKNQIAEYLWTNKIIKMFYTVPDDVDSFYYYTTHPA